jgi:PBP1b-binding outer membrane lipoprotein LpoB
MINTFTNRITTLTSITMVIAGCVSTVEDGSDSPAGDA